MAIKKKDLLKALTKEQASELKKLEDRIDKKLKQEYSPGGTVNIVIKDFPRERVTQELEKKYKEAGWKLEICGGGQRDEGIWITVS